MSSHGHPEDLRDLFTQYAQGVGAQVTCVARAAEAATLLVHGLTSPLTCTAAVRARYPALLQVLGSAGPIRVAEDLAAVEPQPAALAVQLAGAAGVVLARAGVAETGSLLLADDALAPRLLSMLVDTCFVLLPAAAILPDLEAAGALLEHLSAAGHRYLSLVTGPSRTADIERVLTIGVQGPKALHIIIVTEDTLDAGSEEQSGA